MIELTDEDVRKAIEDTIAFEEKMQDPEFLKKLAIQEEKLRSVDLRPMFMRSNEKESDQMNEFDVYEENFAILFDELDMDLSDDFWDSFDPE